MKYISWDSSVIDFLTDYIHPHETLISVRVDHDSCFTGTEFKSFCDSNAIKIKFCTVADHSSNGLVERYVHIVTR